jgi:MOSC domain-containing protein
VITLASIHSYPVKSCRGIAHESALLTAAGLEHDREWMFATPEGRFLTQRDEPRLATVNVSIQGEVLRLSAEGAGGVTVPAGLDGPRTRTEVWGDPCAAIDQGPVVAGWASRLLDREVRLLRFDTASSRRSDAAWTGEVEAFSLFADGFPLLVVSRASLDDLNLRLDVPVPMERFRPNLVLEGLPPFGEDLLHEIERDGVRLRFVKPCTRCVVTTTDQQTGERMGEEPVRTLKAYRWNTALRGVAFGQNAIVVSGAGQRLSAGTDGWTPTVRESPARPD